MFEWHSVSLPSVAPHWNCTGVARDSSLSQSTPALALNPTPNGRNRSIYHSYDIAVTFNRFAVFELTKFMNWFDENVIDWRQI